MNCQCKSQSKCTPRKFADPSIDITLFDPFLEKYAGDDGALIPILQKAQDLYGYLPIDLIEYISCKAEIPLAKVIGVVTFYTQFRMNPVGKNLILLCQGTACHVNGSADIEHAIRDHLKVEEGEITPDGLFTYNNVACIGCCSLAPAMMIGSTTYGHLTKDKCVEILKEIEENAE
ncbi:MAG: NAD(P)H-dependent oxidoreductase subunit E [Oscillospiraceae bacterium]|nr:NAD(P)H-dependent oxidoreductase subunit E [Oscillospiraceae bacterium]